VSEALDMQFMEDIYLCFREPVERALARPGQNYEYELDWWQGLVQRGRRQGDLAGVMQDEGRVLLQGPPEGTSWERWAEWVTERLAQLVEDPEAVAAVPGRLEVWFGHDGVLVANSEDVLQRALSKVRLPSGVTRRDYLTLDVGHPVGTHGPVDWNGRPKSPESSSRIGIVLDRADRSRVVGIHATAAIEDPRAQGWRVRWPSLSSLLGGWFSLGSFGHDGSPLVSQYSMLRLESDEVLERFAGEGRELLELPEDDLRAALIAFGCAVEVSWVRTWLEWMFWRIEYFDWK